MIKKSKKHFKTQKSALQQIWPTDLHVSSALSLMKVTIFSSYNAKERNSQNQENQPRNSIWFFRFFKFCHLTFQMNITKLYLKLTSTFINVPPEDQERFGTAMIKISDFKISYQNYRFSRGVFWSQRLPQKRPRAKKRKKSASHQVERE